MNPSPKLLVILRIGADHRVASWAKTPAARRVWDLILSPYETIPDLDEFDAERVVPIKGGKWDAIYRILSENPELLAKYDYFWLPDDDIEADPTCPSELLATAKKYALQLCQPALRVDSQFSHLVTIRNRFTDLRYTNFVELMAPLMTSHVLRQSLPHMKGRWAAQGLDYFWHRFAEGRSDRLVAVIDSVQIGHYRPKGQHLEGRRQCPKSGEAAQLPSLFKSEANRDYCPLTLASLQIRFRAGQTALALANLLASPLLWKRENIGKVLTYFGGQLFLSNWQGTR